MMIREQWLMKAVDLLRSSFEEVGYPLPKKIYVSVGFGWGSKAESKTLLGQCWQRAASTDSVNHVFLSPSLPDTTMTLGTLVHELIHAALDCQDGHRGRFAEAATRLGLTGKMTVVTVGPELALKLAAIASEIGTWDHGVLDPKTAVVVVGPDGSEVRMHSGPKKQGTRYHKMVCPDDGYTARITSKWIDFGLPACPCGAFLEETD